MYANASLTFTRRIQQGALNVEMRGVASGIAVWVFASCTTRVRVGLLYLIGNNAIGIYRGTQY